MLWRGPAHAGLRGPPRSTARAARAAGSVCRWVSAARYSSRARRCSASTIWPRLGGPVSRRLQVQPVDVAAWLRPPHDRQGARPPSRASEPPLPSPGHRTRLAGTARPRARLSVVPRSPSPQFLAGDLRRVERGDVRARRAARPKSRSKGPDATSSRPRATTHRAMLETSDHHPRSPRVWSRRRRTAAARDPPHRAHAVRSRVPSPVTRPSATSTRRPAQRVASRGRASQAAGSGPVR